MNNHSLTVLICLLLLDCRGKPELTTGSEAALRNYKEGVQLWSQFYYTEARVQFDSSLTADSGFAMGWARLAVLNLDTRDEHAARQNIERALHLSINASELEQLYIRYWNRQIRFLGEGAAAVVDSIITLYPEEAEAHVMRGGLYERGAMLDSAIAHYREAVKLDSGYARAVMLLGYAYSTAGEEEKAIDQMQRYIRLAPDLADPRASYADLLLRVGRYDEALDQYDRSLELKPDYWYSISQIGFIYSILGRLRDAEKQFELGMALLPQNPQLEADRVAVVAGLDMQRGNYARALEQYSKALALDSVNFDASFGLVLALAKLGRFDEAAPVIKRIQLEIERRHLTESPVMVGYHMMRGRVLLDERRLDQARGECLEALDRAQPIARAPVFRLLAEISLKERNFDQALNEVEEALSVNPNSTSALLTLTRIYHADGERRMTQEIGGRLLEFWKSADDDFKDLAELKGLLGSSPAVSFSSKP